MFGAGVKQTAEEIDGTREGRTINRDGQCLNPDGSDTRRQATMVSDGNGTRTPAPGHARMGNNLTGADDPPNPSVWRPPERCADRGIQGMVWHVTHTLTKHGGRTHSHSLPVASAVHTPLPQPEAASTSPSDFTHILASTAPEAAEVVANNRRLHTICRACPR